MVTLVILVFFVAPIAYAVWRSFHYEYGKGKSSRDH